MAFSRQEYWSGLPFPSPEDLPDPGIEPGSPAFQADSLPFELQGRGIEAVLNHVRLIIYSGFPGGAGGKGLACQCRNQKRPIPVLARRTPRAEEPGGLQSRESQAIRQA